MSRLPVIVGFGGINAAGRVSFNHAYRRLVVDVLSEADRALTYQSLATLMNLRQDPATPATRAHIDDHTLIRRIELFDPETIRCNREVSLRPADSPLEFLIDKRQLPQKIPDGWHLQDRGARSVKVTVQGHLKTLLPDERTSRVSGAGQAPSGFDYSPRSRNSEVTLMEWFLILTIRVPLAICLVAQVQ